VRAKRVLVCPRLGVSVSPVDCLTCEEPCAPRNFIFSLMEIGDIVAELEDAGFNVIGVSELTDCPRRAYFRRTETLEPLTWDSLVRIMLGSASHEKAANTDIGFTWNELPVIYQLNHRWILMGRVDVYDPHTRTLWDLKTTSYWAFKNEKLPYSEHVAQLSIYVWVFRRIGVAVDHAKLLYVFRDAKRSSEQWITYDVTEELWSDNEAERYIEDLTSRLENAVWRRDPSDLPFVSEEKRYKCESCPWRNKCLPRKNGQTTLEVSVNERT